MTTHGNNSWSSDGGQISAVIQKFAEQTVGHRLVNNVLRGSLIESIIALELEPDWRWTGGNYGDWDFEHQSGVKLEVKQSAVQQSWKLGSQSRKSPPKFDIAFRKSRNEFGDFVEDPERAADLYLFAYHPVEGGDADHRNPDQWIFYLLPEKCLPHQKTINLSRIKMFGQPVGYSALLQTCTLGLQSI